MYSAINVSIIGVNRRKFSDAMYCYLRAIFTIIIFFSVVAPSAMAQEMTDANGVDGATILVLTSFREGVDVEVADGAVATICEELEITGFNVIRLAPAEDSMLNLKQMIGDGFERHQASIAVVITQASLVDGTVMLFGKKGTDEVAHLDSEYVEFPLDRDTVELVAFKISEKAALLLNDMQSSASPIPIADSDTGESNENQVGSKAGPKDAPADDETSVTAPSRYRWGAYFTAGGTALIRDFILAGGGLGVRWVPLAHKVFDLELSAYPISNKVGNENAGVSLGIAVCRGRAVHVIRLNEVVSLNIGLFAGAVFYWTVRGRVAEPGANELPTYFSRVKGGLFHAGGTGGIVLQLSRRVQLPIFIEAGVVAPRVNFAVENVGGGGAVMPQTVASTGNVILTASVGGLLSF